mgnify:FL=1
MRHISKACGKKLIFPLLLILILFAWTQSVEARLMNKKLSGEMIDAGDVTYYTISPDGRYVVFVADAHDDEVFEIFSVPTIGGPRVTLFTAPAADLTVIPKITPDSSHVVFIVGGSARIYNFYAVPIASGPIVELFEGGRISHSNFNISNDSKNVFFREDRSTPVYHEIIWRLPINGSPPVRISPETCETCRYDFIISPDNQNIVYTEDSDTPPISLFSVDLDGNNRQMYAEWVVNFDITPNGNEVIFTKQLPTSPKINLYAVPISGGVPIQLNGDLVEGGQVMWPFKITPDSQHVLYRADESVDDQYLLYGADIDGSDHWPLIDVAIPVPATMDVITFDITPNSQGVIFKANPFVEGRFDLFSVPILGGSPYHLNYELTDYEYIMSERVTPNSLGLVYLAHIEPGLTELFAVSIFGTDHVKLNPTLPSGGSVANFLISPNSQGVVYIADQEMAHVDNLYAVPTWGGVSPVQLNPPLVSFGNVSRFSITTDSKGVVYLADQEVDGQWELFLTFDFQLVYLPLIVH